MYLIYSTGVGKLHYIHESSEQALKARIKHMLEEGSDYDSLNLRQVLNHGGEVILTDRYQPRYDRSNIQDYLKADKEQPAVAFDRKPSMDIPLPVDNTRCAKPRMPGSTLWCKMFADAKTAHIIAQNAHLGFIGTSGTRGWFQLRGDPSPYSIELTTQELDMFIH